MKELLNFQINGLNIQAEFFSEDRDLIFLPLLRRLKEMRMEKGRPIVAFLAAPPAAGKSTLCRYLELLSRREGDLEPVQAVGIDGFHYPQAYLNAHQIIRDGRAIPLSRIKGAPESYDVGKLKAHLQAVGTPGLTWPLYDRHIHDPVDGAIQIDKEILLVEGNWLLMDEAPWSDLACDYSIFLRAGDPKQLEHIVQRKMMGGYDERTAREAVKNNDWPNIQRCLAHSRRADLNLGYGPDGRMEEI